MNLNSKYFDIIRIYRARTQTQSARHICDWPDCTQPGGYPAPVAADSDEKRYFCLTHIKIYNKSFNFFAGMDEEDIAAYQHASQCGHRPSWMASKKYKSVGLNGGRRGYNGTKGHNAPKWQDSFGLKWYHRLQGHDPFELLQRHRQERQNKTHIPPKQANTRQIRALSVLGLDENSTPKSVKPRYKELVKRYHPDANNGDRSLEIKLNQTIQAYHFLQASGFC